jgi:hypothetical protein
MLFNLIVALITLVLALNGLLFQPKKDPNGAVKWSNLNRTGKVLLIFILSLGILNIAKGIIDDRNNKKYQDDLRQTNQYIIKVMSVADGYNALIRGVVTFTQPVSEDEFRKAADNLFLKYVTGKLYAQNKLGRYEGRMDYGTHPALWKFRNLSQISDDTILSRYRNVFAETPENQRFFYEIKFSKLKMLSPDRIQYARLDDTDEVRVTVEENQFFRDFGEVYHVNAIFIDELEIEELGKYEIKKRLRF